jgi:hypothetical protein
MNELLKEAVVKWRRKFPEISEEEALADLFHRGWACDETWQAFNRREAESLDRQHNVIKDPREFAGWHIAGVELWKRVVYKFMRSRASRIGYEMEHGFCSQDVLRVAIEAHICQKPDGYVLPQ